MSYRSSLRIAGWHCGGWLDPEEAAEEMIRILGSAGAREKARKQIEGNAFLYNEHVRYWGTVYHSMIP